MKRGILDLTLTVGNTPMSITNHAHDNSAESRPRSSDQFLNATVDTTSGQHLADLLGG